MFVHVCWSICCCWQLPTQQQYLLFYTPQSWASKGGGQGGIPLTICQQLSFFALFNHFLTIFGQCPPSHTFQRGLTRMTPMPTITVCTRYLCPGSSQCTVRLFVRSFVCSFLYLFVRSLILAFVRSFVICSFEIENVPHAATIYGLTWKRRRTSCKFHSLLDEAFSGQVNVIQDNAPVVPNLDGENITVRLGQITGYDVDRVFCKHWWLNIICEHIC